MTAIRLAPPVAANAHRACRRRAAANHERVLAEYRLLQDDLIEEDRVARAQCAVCLLTAAFVLARVAVTYLYL